MSPLVITGVFTVLAALSGSFASGWWTRRKIKSEASKYDSESDKINAEATETIGRTYQQMLQNTTKEIERLTILVAIVREDLDKERELTASYRVQMESVREEIASLKRMVNNNEIKIKTVEKEVEREIENEDF